MQLKIQKKTEHDKSSQIIIENQCWGVLYNRALLALYPIPFEGEIGQREADELKAMLYKQASDLLLRYVADSEHSSTQCRDYLKRKNFHSGIISKIVTDFLEKKYIDDRRFVNMLIESLLERQKSRMYIVNKLKETRLPGSLWEDVLREKYNPRDSLDSLKEQVLRLRLRYSDLPQDKQKEKIFASLFRKGFELDLIHEAWAATKP
jgi:SOS response regulatory protein OraA/RecX